MPRHLKLPRIPKTLTERIISPTIGHFLPTTPPPHPATASGQFQIMSDLHLELFAVTPTNPDPYLEFSIPPRAPYLLLAGDIGLLVHHYPRYLSFLRRQTSVFERVFLVLGNHEFYKSSRAATLLAAERMEAEEGLCGRLSVMHRKRVDLSFPDGVEVSVLGATLHSHIPAEAEDRVRRSVRDFSAIEGWSVAEHNREHELDKQWLKDELADVADQQAAAGVVGGGERLGGSGGGGSNNNNNRRREVVVVTHHAPSFVGTCAPVHDGSEIGSAFCSEIVEEIAGAKGGENVRLWAFGHTHFSTDFCFAKRTWRRRSGSGAAAAAAGIRLVANQKGYFDENAKSFDVGMVVGV